MFWGWQPAMQKVYHVLPRTAAYYHVLPRTSMYYTRYYQVLSRTTTYSHILLQPYSFCISGSHPCMSVLSCHYFTTLYTILLFYYFTISLHIVLPWPMFGVGSPRCKKFTTYYHVLPHTTTYYHVLPRTSMYYQFFTTYYHVLPRTHILLQPYSFASRAATLACRSSHVTILLLYILIYYFTISLHIVLPWPMFGVGSPRCK